MLLSHDKDKILEKILRSYESYYDIENCQENDVPLVAKCEFHVHNEKFVLTKKAKLWDADANEYVYIFKTNNLTNELFTKCKDFAYTNGMNLINPKPGHMYSYISAIFICDSCDEEAERTLKKCKIFKNFKFSIHGWMDYHTTCINLDKSKIYGNKGARGTTKFLEDLLIERSSTFKGVKRRFKQT